MTRTFASTADRAHAYTLRVTTCTHQYSKTSDEDFTFEFCTGGSYCEPGDDLVYLPSGVSISDGSTIEISVSLGYEPTTVDIVKNSGYDAW